MFSPPARRAAPGPRPGLGLQGEPIEHLARLGKSKAIFVVLAHQEGLAEPSLSLLDGF